MSETTTITMTPGLHCCLLCRRMLIDRTQHEALEERALAALRTEYADVAGNAEGERESSVEYYRDLLQQRGRRAERSRGLRAIQLRRRKERREKLLNGVRVLASAWRGHETLAVR